jgi:perosamine synthetase
MKRIPVAGPWVTAKEIEYVTDAATTSWGENANVYVHRFERAFAERVGVRHAVSLPSCTSAIHLSLAALGVGPGDEVVVPDLTWIASVAPVTYVGATAVFADVDEKTWCLSAKSFESVITRRTKAVIPVDLYGGMPDMTAIRAVAERHGIAIVEDAAEAVGSRYRGRAAGSLGDTGVFSFHGSKTLTTGEGGMLVTDRDDLFKRTLVLRDHGRQPGDTSFVNTEVAFKYKMSALQAAFGLGQVERLDELVTRKRAIFEWYREDLLGTDGVTLNHEPPDVFNSYWMVTVILDPARGIDKTELMGRMSERGIDCRPIFSPLSSLPAFAAHPSAPAASVRNKISYALGPYGVNLPSGFNLDRDTVRYVAESLRAALAAPREGAERVSTALAPRAT